MATKSDQLHELLIYCMGFAKVMLWDLAEFYPFGAVIGTKGKLKAMGASEGNECADPQNLYDLLGDIFKSLAAKDEMIATAMATNVNIPPAYESAYLDGIR